MARWVAVALGIVVVGLLAAGMPWGTTAADEDRIAALEARVTTLERRAVRKDLPFAFTCAQGSIIGLISSADTRSRDTIELGWTPDDGIDNPLFNAQEGSATFTDCRTVVAP